ARRSGSARQARCPGVRRRRKHARGVPRLCARRVGEVGEGDPRLQYQGRVIQGVPMTRDAKWIPRGVIPAVLLPFHEDLSIDEPSFRAHFRDVASAEGLSAITINAHSTEVASCSFDEQKRVLAIAKDEIGDRLPIVHGVYAEGSLEAARIAKMAAEGGAAALLVFPPGPFTMGQRPEMAVEHFRRVARAAVRPPLVKIPQAEIEQIRKALIAAGLLDNAGKARKAA